MSSALDELYRVIEEEGDAPLSVVDAVVAVAEELSSTTLGGLRLLEYLEVETTTHVPRARVALSLLFFIHENAIYLNSLECASPLAKLVYSSSEVYYEKLPPSLQQQQPRSPSIFHMMYLVYVQLMHREFDDQRDERAKTFQDDCSGARFHFMAKSSPESNVTYPLSQLLACSDEEFESFVSEVAGAHMDLDFASPHFKRVILALEFAFAERVFNQGTMTLFHVVDLCSIRLMCMRIEHIEREHAFNTVRPALVRNMPTGNEVEAVDRFFANVVKTKELAQGHMRTLYTLVSRRLIPVGLSLFNMRGTGYRATTPKLLSIGSLALDELNKRQMYAFGTTEVKELGVFYRAYRRWGLCSLFTLLFTLQALLANSIGNLFEQLCTDTPTEEERHAVCIVSPTARFIIQTDRFFVIYNSEIVDTDQDAMAAMALLMRSIRENDYKFCGAKVKDLINECWVG